VSRLWFLLVLFLCEICHGQNLVSDSQCVNNLLINGSFNSIEGEAITAPGWTGGSTPDINDDDGPLNTTPGYVWLGTPYASSDGGTWQNIFGGESIEQTINVIQGQSYTLCFEYAAQGITDGDTNIFVGPVGIHVFINNVASFITPLDTTQYTWETGCYTFIPSVALITISMTASGTLYIGVDGACILPTFNLSNEGHLKPEVIISRNIINGYLEVKVNSDELSEIAIYDISSRKLFQEKFRNFLTLNTNQFAKGIYILHMVTGDGQMYVTKLVIDH